MRNFRQAPKLYHSEGKEKKNTYMLPQKLMDSVFNQLDGKHGNQIKLMTVLLGTAGNGSFAVSEKWICDRTGMDQSNYNRARKALIEKGWLKLEDGHIYVDFDAIRRLPDNSTSTHVGDMSSGNRGCGDHMPETCADNMHNIENIKKQIMFMTVLLYPKGIRRPTKAQMFQSIFRINSMRWELTSNPIP